MLRLPSKPGMTSRIGKPLAGRSGSPFCLHDFVGERDAPVETGAVAALRQHPRGSAVLPDKIDQESEWNSRPFTGADQSMRVLYGQVLVGSFPILPSVA